MFDYRYSQLPLVFARLIREGHLEEGLLAGIAETFARGLAIVRRPSRLLIALLLSFPLWLMICLGTWAMTRAFGLAIPFAGSFLLVAILVLGVAVPTPGAVGGFHEAFRVGATVFFLNAVQFRPQNILLFLLYLAAAVCTSWLNLRIPTNLGGFPTGFLLVLLGIVELSLPEVLFIGCAATLLSELRQAKFKVKLYWEVSGEVEVEADSPQEAVEKALGPETPLPENPEYVQDSQNCDVETDVQEVREEP